MAASNKKASKSKFPEFKINRVWLLSIASVLVLGLVGATVFLNYSGFFEKSQATIFEDQGSIALKFNIAKKDQARADIFARELGIGNSWQTDLNLKFDAGTMGKLGGILPVTLDLIFKGSELDFQTPGVRFLNTGGSGQDFTFASGSGILKMHQVSDRTFFLSLKNPAYLEQSATESGQIYLSPRINGLFQVAQKIDTIDLRVDSGNVAGSIRLK